METKVRKRIGRTIQPQSFESLQVSVEYEDVIEWDTIEKRQKKLDDHLQLVIYDFQRSFERICKELKLQEKPINVVHTTPDGVVKTAALPKLDEEIKVEDKKKKPANPQDVDDFFDSLDQG